LWYLLSWVTCSANAGTCSAANAGTCSAANAGSHGYCSAVDAALLLIVEHDINSKPTYTPAAAENDMIGRILIAIHLRVFKFSESINYLTRKLAYV
jgi:hypothetical protein